MCADRGGAEAGGLLSGLQCGVDSRTRESGTSGEEKDFDQGVSGYGEAGLCWPDMTAHWQKSGLHVS